MTRGTMGWILGLSGLIVVGSLIRLNYGGQSGSIPQQGTYVEATLSVRAEMQIALPDGTLPCGLKQIEWGQQIFELEKFPSCPRNALAVKVYCLNGEAEWTSDALIVTRMSVVDITFDAQREGICGIFPKR